MPIGYQTYANLQDRVEQFLQDTSNATYDTTELGMWIEEALKDFSDIVPHLITVIFKIESRHGTDVTGTASSLTDASKSQFLAADATNEKVIHNTTDNTWAVVESRTSSSVLVLSADIMDANEKYRIYNKRCKSEKEIYIGDMAPFIGVVKVEYPLGVRREFTLLDDKIEIHISSVGDSDSTLSPPRDIDVYVTFAVPHVLSQLTAWTWELTGDEVLGATDVDIDVASHGAGTIETGEEFHVENHRSLYKVNADATITTNGAETATIYFYPPLEAAASDNDDVVFRKSTLNPIHENILYRWVCGIALQSESMNRINVINPGGRGVYERFEEKGERMVAKAKWDLMQWYDVDLWANMTLSSGRTLSDL